MIKKRLDVFRKSEALVGAIIGKMGNINKSREKFMIHLFMLFLGLRGRFNFLNMSRYGIYSEQSYRNNFEEKFDFINFNSEIIRKSCSKHLINAFDPSYIPKSGKQTDHLGKFWSGSSGKALRGIEIGGFAVVDVDNNTALSLEAIQTPSPTELKCSDKTLVKHYASLILERKEVLISFSQYLAVDAYFAKKEFINPIMAHTDLHIISKMRDDANLYYIYKGQPTGLPGRPKELDGKINMKQIDKRRIKLCFENENVKIYEAIVFSKSLKRKIKLAYVMFFKEQIFTGEYWVLFSTDINLAGDLIYQYYKCRFQIEFLFRDAKQFTGLTHCQAQSENKLHFHFNASLSAVSIAKAAYYLPLKKEKRKSFSMCDVKTIHLNKIMADRIFTNLKIDMSCKKYKRVYRDALWFGKIAS